MPLNNLLQVDVKEVSEITGVVSCNLYTGERCVKIIMHIDSYNDLVRDGFFIRDGKSKDSANVLNTTLGYTIAKHEQE